MEKLNTILEVEDLTVYYGTVCALNKVSLFINEGEIVALIGPNGAGKSTALKAICGLLRPFNGEIRSGEIMYLGRSIKGLMPHQLVKMGLSLVPEGRRIFRSMTVRENLEMGAFIANKKREIGERLKRVFELFPILNGRQGQRAGTLSSGEQQMLVMGRALMLRPRLLLLDEPSLGLSPNYVELVFKKISEINSEGTSLIIVEQNALAALEVAHRAYLFEGGRVVKEGSREEFLKTDMVKMAILGR